MHYAKRNIKQLALPFVVLFGLIVLINAGQSQHSSALKLTIPKTWDDDAIATIEVPLADPIGSPKHVSSDYYYRIPVAPIYKSYPVYAPDREPPGYMAWLSQQEPEILWDEADRAPRLKAPEDWIRAGEIVFDAPVRFGGSQLVESVRKSFWYEETGTRSAKDGTLPIFR